MSSSVNFMLHNKMKKLKIYRLHQGVMSQLEPNKPIVNTALYKVHTFREDIQWETVYTCCVGTFHGGNSAQIKGITTRRS